MGGTFVPVRNSEIAHKERTTSDDKAERAHRAFDNPHTLHRGLAPEDSSDRDLGQQVVRKAPTMIKNEKGLWVKPDKETLAKMKAEWEDAQKRERDDHEAREREAKQARSAGDLPPFVPSPSFEGAQAGYYFSTGAKGTGYYLESEQGSSAASEASGGAACGGSRSEGPRDDAEPRGDDRHRVRDRDRGHRRNRSRERSRERSGGRRERDGDRDREYDRHRNYRERDTDRGRDLDRGRDRSRERGGGRAAERERSPERRFQATTDKPAGQTKEEKERAALERLMAKRQQGTAPAVGGVPKRGGWAASKYGL
ncbi:hypothetical protein CYMTET_37088 [Cymbomonas tetramitiformis]|uniref:Uncharacterized protein n=1 Tax=Cymbomonas tetramitiformis TaxID=36881 RepID=A0AAE0CEP6_9CHLO|nr:hypothetical protein CYMTET_37088 [Cymbomonas tetramitiformis]